MSSIFPKTLVKLAISALVKIIVYIDDLLVHSKNHEEHLHQLDQSFLGLRNVGLKAKLSKCKFGATNLKCFKFRLTPEGTLPGIDKLKEVKSAELPNSKKRDNS